MGNNVSTKSKQVLAMSFGTVKNKHKRSLSTMKMDDKTSYDLLMKYLKTIGDDMMEFRHILIPGFLMYITCRVAILMTSKPEEDTVILLGESAKARRRVLEYFEPLDSVKTTDGVIKKTKLFLHKYRWTVFSTEAFKDLKDLNSQFDGATLLICQPSKTELTTAAENWISETCTSVENELPLIHIGPVVLTDCSCKCIRSHCKIPLNIQLISNEDPIMHRCDGHAFGHRLFCLKHSRHMRHDIKQEFSYLFAFLWKIWQFLKVIPKP